ncbi:hypothetical protein [Actinopolymorpha sp. B9G3]|uniref:hypothetical protein n=1 Tax=Actinopolymorpha sp. B9G3 TaxID=3158970 RepID=UPI0032D9A89E
MSRFTAPRKALFVRTLLVRTPLLRALLVRTLGVGMVAAFLTLGGVVLAPVPACACSCVPTNPAEAFARADAVFVGRVVDRASKDRFPWESTGVEVWTFEVERIYKGEVQRRQEIVTMESGASCGLELDGSGPFVIYATHDSFDIEPQRDQYAAGLCDGSQPLTAEVERSLAAQAPAGPIMPAGSVDASGENRDGVSTPLVVGLGAIGAVVAAVVGWLKLHG